MKKSESIVELSKALCKVQAELRGYKEDSTNLYYKSKYGDLSSVWAAVRKPLTDAGLSVTQVIDRCEPMQMLPELKNKKGEVLPPPGDPITIETILMHTSGEWISGRLEIRAERPGPQAVGIAITYGRRYALAAIVGVAPEDDDAEGATNHGKANGNAANNQKKKPVNPLTEIYTKAKADPYFLKDAEWKKILKEIGITKSESSYSGKNSDRLKDLKTVIKNFRAQEQEEQANGPGDAANPHAEPTLDDPPDGE